MNKVTYMKNTNIHFVGYMLEKEDKAPFLDLFDCKEKFFLEASKKALLYNDSQAKYFPEILYRSWHKRPTILITPSILMTPLVKKLYQRDIKHFKGSMPNKVKVSKINFHMLLLIYTFLALRKREPESSKYNVLKIAKEYLSNIKKHREKDEILQKKLVYFLFRVKFILGYLAAKKVLDNTVFSKDDIYILWGKSYSSKILLLDYLSQYKVPYVIAEYGEVPGTISFSPHGIFGEVFSIEAWETLNKKALTQEDLDYTSEILDTIKSNQISTRSYDTNLYFLMKHFYNNSVQKEDRKKTIYVNGAELFSSALYFNRWNIGNHGQNPNKMLLEQVVSTFKNTDYMIIYKEHPMSMEQTKKILINPSDFPTVNFIKDMNIHDIMDLSDIIVTYPSKVVITALQYEKTTFVVGDFTIPYSIPKIRYFTGNKLEDIAKEFIVKSNYDKEAFVAFIARMIKYSLIVIDDDLHTNSNHDIEKSKINAILKQCKLQYIKS